MKKTLSLAMLSLALVFSCTPEEKKESAVLELVSAETITSPATGGEYTIEVNSNSALTASSSQDWVSVAVVDKSTVKATVAKYDGDATRSATVTINNDSDLTPLQVRINQAAVTFDFNPTDYEFDAAGGEYSFPYTAETALVATPDEYAEGWLTVEVTGTEVVLKAAANTEVKTRASIVEWTIGSAKGEFEVTQKAAAATFEGTFDDVNAPAEGTTVVYEYTTNSELIVNSDDAWIEAYTEDGKLNIIVAPNSGAVREGVVTWSVKSSDKSGEIKVSQKGAFINVELVPYVANTSGSNLTNTLALRISAVAGETIQAIKYVAFYAGGSLAGVSTEQLKAEIDQKGQSFQNDWLQSVNAAGLTLSIGAGTREAGTTYDAIVWATNGTEDAYFALSASTRSDVVLGEYDTQTQFYLINSKSSILGDYYFLAKEGSYVGSTIAWSARNQFGKITFTDGGIVQDEYGEYDMIDIEGMWGPTISPGFKFTNDIFQLDLYNGFLYNQDPESLGNLLNAKGEVYAQNINLYSMFAGSNYIFRNLYGTLAGGILDEDGIIALISTDMYADQTDSQGMTLGEYQGVIMQDNQYYYTILKDFMFIPAESYSPAKVAAASMKVEAIKKEMGKLKRNYVEVRDSRVEKAFSAVLSDSQYDKVDVGL